MTKTMANEPINSSWFDYLTQEKADEFVAYLASWLQNQRYVYVTVLEHQIPIVRTGLALIGTGALQDKDADFTQIVVSDSYGSWYMSTYLRDGQNPHEHYAPYINCYKQRIEISEPADQYGNRFHRVLALEGEYKSR